MRSFGGEEFRIKKGGVRRRLGKYCAGAVGNKADGRIIFLDLSRRTERGIS